MDLDHALAEQEQAAKEQNQIASRNPLVADVKQRCNQPGEPYDGEQQRDAREHRKRQAGDPRSRLTLRWQSSDQDRNEDDVIEPEHDLEQRQRREGQPTLRIRKQFQHDPERILGRTSKVC